jgi:hypothetical protein
VLICSHNVLSLAVSLIMKTILTSRAARFLIALAYYEFGQEKLELFKKLRLKAPWAVESEMLPR